MFFNIFTTIQILSKSGKKFKSQQTKKKQQNLCFSSSTTKHKPNYKKKKKKKKQKQNQKKLPLNLKCNPDKLLTKQARGGGAGF
jgi:hypothetical protein